MEQTVMERPQYRSSDDQPRKKRGGYLLLIVLVIVFAIAAVAGIMVRLTERHAVVELAGA